jgi:chemotaxis protein CheX
MRVEYINPFVEAAFSVLQEVLDTEINRGELFLKPSSQPILGVTTIIGLTGSVEGRVLFDMSETTALAIASGMNGEELSSFDELAKATITELSNMIAAQAVTKLYELGFEFDISPPALFTGENMEVSTTEFEALIVPIDMPLGKLEINVAVREKRVEAAN